MLCATCGAQNEGGRESCGECGVPLSDPVTETVSRSESGLEQLEQAGGAVTAPSQLPGNIVTPEHTGLERATSSDAPATRPATPAPQPVGVTIINQQSVGAQAVNPALLGLTDKNPGVALLLSFLIVGAGQLYNGQVLKGIFMFISAIALWFLLMGWIVHLWSWFDAYIVAKKKHLQWQMALSGAGSQGAGQVAKFG